MPVLPSEEDIKALTKMSLEAEAYSRKTAWDQYCELVRMGFRAKMKKPKFFVKSSAKNMMMVSSMRDKYNRIILVDTAASYHLIGLDELTPDEFKEAKKLPEPIEMGPGNGQVEVAWYTRVCVKDLGLTLKFMILENSLNAISVGLLRKEHGITFTWGDDGPILWRKDGVRKIRCTVEDDVPQIMGVKPILKTTDEQSSSPASKLRVEKASSSTSKRMYKPLDGIAEGDESEPTPPLVDSSEGESRSKARHRVRR